MSAKLAELAEVLAQCGRLDCAPAVETNDDSDVVTITVVVEAKDGNTGAEVYELFLAVQRVVDLATMRALCQRYNINEDAFASLKQGESE